jgi:hypothetical protein
MWWFIHLQFMGQAGFQLIEAKLVPFEEDEQHINELNNHPNNYVANIDFNLYGGNKFLEEQEAVQLAEEMAWVEKGSYLQYRQTIVIPETILPKILIKRIGAN